MTTSSPTLYTTPISPLPPWRGLRGPFQAPIGLTWQGQPLVRSRLVSTAEDVEDCAYPSWPTLLETWYGPCPRRGLCAVLLGPADAHSLALERLQSRFGPPTLVVPWSKTRRLADQLGIPRPDRGQPAAFSVPALRQLRDQRHDWRGGWLLFGVTALQPFLDQQGTVHAPGPKLTELSELVDHLGHCAVRVSLEGEPSTGLVTRMETAAPQALVHALEGLATPVPMERWFEDRQRERLWPARTAALEAKGLSVWGDGPLGRFAGAKAQRVSLHDSDWIDATPLATLPELHTLRATRGALWSIAGLTGLRTLRLGDSPLRDPHELAALPRLERLSLEWARVDALRALAAAPGLRHLELFETDDDALAMDALGALVRLRTLTLHGVSPKTLAPLSTLTHLRSLTLERGTRDPIDLRPLAPLTALRKLDVLYPQVSSLETLTGLRLNNLSLCAFDLDLSPLARMPALRRLSLRGEPLPEALLPQLGHLQHLNLMDMTDLQVAPLRQLTGLRTLTVAGADVVDPEALKSLDGVRILLA